MGTLFKKIELFANLSIIIVAVLFSFVLVKRFVLASSDTSHLAIREDIKPGAKISLPDYDWSKSKQHLVVALQTGCHFCSESAPFYQRIVQVTSGRKDIQLLATFPQDIQTGKQYLDDLGVQITEIKQAHPLSLGVQGTPTILAVNDSGVVVKAWMGKLSSDKESELLNYLSTNCEVCN